MNQTSTSDTIRKEIAINAPAERVFEALVDPNQRLQWWGHGPYRMTHAESDLRPGGKWELHVEADGRTTSARGEYRAGTTGWPDVLASLRTFVEHRNGNGKDGAASE